MSAPSLPRIGVLAVQGDFEAHLSLLRPRARAWQVRTSADLRREGGVDGLVLPGGESTTQIRLLKAAGLWDDIAERGRQCLPIFGTCAGAILLSRRVEVPSGRPEQDALELLDASIRRNAYGRQTDSFEADVPGLPGGPFPVVCIRAPRFIDLGPSVEVLLAWDGEPLLVRQGSIWAATFHPELTSDSRVHDIFLGQVEAGREGAVKRSANH